MKQFIFLLTFTLITQNILLHSSGINSQKTIADIKNDAPMRPIIESLKKDPLGVLATFNATPGLETMRISLQAAAANELLQEYVTQWTYMPQQQRQSIFQRMLHLGVKSETIQRRLSQEQARRMRLHIMQELAQEKLLGKIDNLENSLSKKEADALGATEKEYKTHLTQTKEYEKQAGTIKADTHPATSALDPSQAKHRRQRQNRIVGQPAPPNLYMQIIEEKDPKKLESLLKDYMLCNFPPEGLK